MNSHDPKARKLYRLRAHQNGGHVRVDAAPVREKALRLAEFYSQSTIAAEAGIAQSTISRLIAGAFPTVNPDVAKAIASTKERLLGEGRAKVLAVGTARRVQALRAIGWPADDIAKAIGMSPQGVSFISTGKAKWVYASTRDAVIEAYGRMWGAGPVPDTNFQRGGYDRARRHAARMGWVPPLAWDDDTIDDPDATPTLGTAAVRPGGGTPVHELIEDVEFLLRHDPYMTSTELAHRLGYADKSGVQNALAADRGNRPDLLAQLARNAEVKAA